MKTRNLLSFSVVLLAALRLDAQVIISNITYSSGQNIAVSDTTIEAGPTVTVQSGAIVSYRATTSVTLKPGFQASAGSSFRAFIFQDSDGDGIDNAWELSHGLDPNNASDAQLTTSGGLTYLLEYRLGTEPANTKSTDSSNATQLKVHRPTTQ